MKKFLFLLLSAVFLVVGLVAMLAFEGSMAAIIEGAAKGLAGVFFVLFYIFLLLGKEPEDKSTAH